MKRKLFAVSGLASGAVAAALAYRYWLGDKRERLDVYFDDGSFTTFVEGSPGAERLLPLARDAFSAPGEG
jgi:hypothetical protein